jgi:hypothetical protein
MNWVGTIMVSWGDGILILFELTNLCGNVYSDNPYQILSSDIYHFRKTKNANRNIQLDANSYSYVLYLHILYINYEL